MIAYYNKTNERFVDTQTITRRTYNVRTYVRKIKCTSPDLPVFWSGQRSLETLEFIPNLLCFNDLESNFNNNKICVSQIYPKKHTVVLTGTHEVRLKRNWDFKARDGRLNYDTRCQILHNSKNAGLCPLKRPQLWEWRGRHNFDLDVLRTYVRMCVELWNGMCDNVDFLVASMLGGPANTKLSVGSLQFLGSNITLSNVLCRFFLFHPADPRGIT